MIYEGWQSYYDPDWGAPCLEVIPTTYGRVMAGYTKTATFFAYLMDNEAEEQLWL